MLGIAERKVAILVPYLFLIIPAGINEKKDPRLIMETDHAAWLIVNGNSSFSNKIGTAGELHPKLRPKINPPPQSFE